MCLLWQRKSLESLSSLAPVCLRANIYAHTVSHTHQINNSSWISGEASHQFCLIYCVGKAPALIPLKAPCTRHPHPLRCGVVQVYLRANYSYVCIACLWVSDIHHPVLRPTLSCRAHLHLHVMSLRRRSAVGSHGIHWWAIDPKACCSTVPVIVQFV